ncbi:MAG: hypothetical protein IT260_08585 [Saprospiraceae bacterium]|nr:hypothetical protein [Saprospiraceae bacterium]
MIIVWKWRDLPHINEKLWKQEPFQSYIDNIVDGKDHIYKEYPVQYSDLCPDAVVVATAIYKVEENEDIDRLLDSLIDGYAQGSNEVMLLLHRSNNYEAKDVDRLLDRFKGRLSKCFLFADGRDYIYYKTQKSGILDDIGSFQIQRDPKTEEKVSTFADGKVLQPYFDRVWQYYNNEFETKVFQFKEELFDQWLPFLLPGKPEHISRESLLNALREGNERVILSRIKSFLGRYETELQGLDAALDFDQITAVKKEKDTLKDREKTDRISYDFDDCITNLIFQKNLGNDFVSDAYEDAKRSLEHALFAPGINMITQQDLREIADKLNYLVKIIPGELD